MAGALSGIFQEFEQQRGPVMVAPGLPAAALSGNPAATVTNLAAVGGAQAAGALGQGINQLLGDVGLGSFGTVNPMQLQQQRQQAFISRYQEIVANGEVAPGDAMMQAARDLEGILAPDEQLRAMSEGLKQRESDNDLLNKSVDFVNKSKQIEEYRVGKTTHDQLIKTAKDKPSAANDFLIIQQGLKILDPTSIVSKSEIAQGRLSAVGAQELSALGFNVNQLINFAAYGGKKPLLSDSMKARWLQAIGRKVDAQRNAAAEVYTSAYDQFTAAGGPGNIFQRATRSTADLLSGTVQAEIVKNAAGDFTHGGMQETLFGRLDLAQGAIFDAISGVSKTGRKGKQVGPDWLGLEIAPNSPAGWLLGNFGLDTTGQAPTADAPAAALAAAPIAAQQQLQATHGESGPLGLAIDSAMGYPALGPLNDAIISGAQKRMKSGGGF